MTFGMKLILTGFALSLGNLVLLARNAIDMEELEHAVFLMLFALFCVFIQILRDVNHEQQQRKS
jgi:hypothetical protein